MERTARMRAVTATLMTAVLSVVTAVLIGVVTAGPASAHTSLKSASPTVGSTVRPPNRIVLTYADPVRFTQVLVTDAAGRQYQSGSPVNVDNTVTENISSTLPNGRYTVAWRVVAPDGHPVEGTYQFTVTGSTATAPSAAPAAPGGGGQPAAASKSSGTNVWWIVVIVVLIVAAAAGAMLLLRQSASDPGAEASAEAEASPDGEGTPGGRGAGAATTNADADTEAGAGH